jgi:hypothetical protein
MQHHKTSSQEAEAHPSEEDCDCAEKTYPKSYPKTDFSERRISKKAGDLVLSLVQMYPKWIALFWVLVAAGAVFYLSARYIEMSIETKDKA